MFKAIAATAALALTTAAPALAAQYTPASMANDLNGRTWTAGYQVEFSHLRSCREFNSSTYGPANPTRLAALEAEMNRTQQINIEVVEARDAEPYGDQRRGWDRYDQLNAQAQTTWEAYEAARDAYQEEKRNTVQLTSVPSSYGCSGGFVKITSPQGTKVCEVSNVSIDYDDYRATYNSRNCVWRG